MTEQIFSLTNTYYSIEHSVKLAAGFKSLLQKYTVIYGMASMGEKEDQCGAGGQQRWTGGCTKAKDIGAFCSVCVCVHVCCCVPCLCEIVYVCACVPARGHHQVSSITLTVSVKHSLTKPRAHQFS